MLRHVYHRVLHPGFSARSVGTTVGQQPRNHGNQRDKHDYGDDCNNYDYDNDICGDGGGDWIDKLDKACWYTGYVLVDGRTVRLRCRSIPWCILAIHGIVGMSVISMIACLLGTRSVFLQKS